MIIYDIPKEFRQSTKIDLSFKFCRLNSPLCYVSIRNSDNEEVSFYCLKGVHSIDIDKFKEDYPSCRISVIYDSRYDIGIDYYMYDITAYKETSFIKDGKEW